MHCPRAVPVQPQTTESARSRLGSWTTVMTRLSVLVPPTDICIPKRRRADLFRQGTGVGMSSRFHVILVCLDKRGGYRPLVGAGQPNPTNQDQQCAPPPNLRGRFSGGRNFDGNPCLSFARSCLISRVLFVGFQSTRWLFVGLNQKLCPPHA